MREAIAKRDAASMKDEFGDVLFALVNLGRHLKIDSEAALSRHQRKVPQPLPPCRACAQASGRTLDASTLDEMEDTLAAGKERELSLPYALFL